MFYVVFFFSSLYRFMPVELAFLAEYAKTMTQLQRHLMFFREKPVCRSDDCLVPTITLLKTKLQHLHVASKFCEPLIAALLSGLEKWFREMLADPELIAAAILVSNFKTCWTSDENILKLGVSLFNFSLICVISMETVKWVWNDMTHTHTQHYALHNYKTVIWSK